MFSKLIQGLGSGLSGGNPVNKWFEASFIINT